MSASDYDDILNRARKEIPEPVDVPTGTWKLQAVSGKWNEDDEDYIADGMIVFKLVEPQDDVDEEEFNEFAADSMESARIFDRFWLKDVRDVNTLNKKLSMMDVDDELNIKDAVKSVKGHEVMAMIIRKADKDDPNVFYTNAKSFAPVED